PLVFIIVSPPPRSPLFPYTTLFRSHLPRHRQYGRLRLRRAVSEPGRPLRAYGRAAAGCRAVGRNTQEPAFVAFPVWWPRHGAVGDRKSTRLNSSHVAISYAVFCLKK